MACDFIRLVFETWKVITAAPKCDTGYIVSFTTDLLASPSSTFSRVSSSFSTFTIVKFWNHNCTGFYCVCIITCKSCCIASQVHYVFTYVILSKLDTCLMMSDKYNNSRKLENYKSIRIIILTLLFFKKHRNSKTLVIDDTLKTLYSLTLTILRFRVVRRSITYLPFNSTKLKP